MLSQAEILYYQDRLSSLDKKINTGWNVSPSDYTEAASIRTVLLNAQTQSATSTAPPAWYPPSAPLTTSTAPQGPYAPYSGTSGGSSPTSDSFTILRVLAEKFNTPNVSATNYNYGASTPSGVTGGTSPQPGAPPPGLFSGLESFDYIVAALALLLAFLAFRK